MLLAAGRPAAAQDAVVFLVRHAETEPDGTRDPALSAAGAARSAALAALLDDAGIEAIRSTDYRRTRATAAAVADREGLDPVVYDPADLEGLARTLSADGGRVLVVGHSNTTPELVRLLGGDAGAAIHEDEHDRLYILFIEDGDVRTVLLRYGGP